MTKSKKVAVLWFVGGAALLVAGFLAEPRRDLTIAAGILFLVAGIISTKRARQ